MVKLLQTHSYIDRSSYLNIMTKTYRAYFKKDVQLHKTW